MNIFIPPQKIYTPKQISGYAPVLALGSVGWLVLVCLSARFLNKFGVIFFTFGFLMDDVRRRKVS